MKFDIKGLGHAGQFLSLSVDAIDSGEAERKARIQGIDVISVRAASFGFAAVNSARHRAGRIDLLLFSQELLALLEAGLSLVEATEALVEKEQAPESRRVLEGIIASLYEGNSFSTALGAFPDVFPELLVATLRASERTGDLPQALHRFIAHEERMREQRAKIVSALFYPAVVMAVAALVTVGLMWFLIPKFSAVFEGNNRSLPFLSRLVIDWGRLVTAYPFQTFFGSMALVALLAWIVTRPSVRSFLAARIWRSRALGRRLKIFELSRFYRATGMLLRGGIPAMTAFGMVGALLHPSLRLALAQAALEVKEGRAMSDAFSSHGLTTPVALRMLRVGERTGGMGEMMERIASFYDQDVDRWLAWFGKALSPLLLVVLGVFVGGIVLLLYLPIFDIAGSLG
jgi:general secretion pathway protein F